MFPSIEIVEQSTFKYYDRVYNLPKIIECFIDRANKELPKTYSVRPWTINRAVTVFKDNKGFLVIDYESIEQDIVYWLDVLIKEGE